MSLAKVNCMVEAKPAAMIMAGSIDVVNSVRGRRFTGISVLTIRDMVAVAVNAMRRLRVWVGLIMLRLSMNNLIVLEGDLETTSGLCVFLNASTCLLAITSSNGVMSSGSTRLLSNRVSVNANASITSVLYRDAITSASVSLSVSG